MAQTMQQLLFLEYKDNVYFSNNLKICQQKWTFLTNKCFQYYSETHNFPIEYLQVFLENLIKPY